VELASHAARAAYGDPRFPAYFHSDSTGIRVKVASRFHAIAKECAKPRLSYHCFDRHNKCGTENVAFYTGEGVVFYTGGGGYVTICPPFWGMPLVNLAGYGGDRGTVLLHELTHSPEVYKPGTKDLAYGFYNSTERLKTTEAALSNADSFVVFAQGKLICPHRIDYANYAARRSL